MTDHRGRSDVSFLLIFLSLFGSILALGEIVHHYNNKSYVENTPARIRAACAPTGVRNVENVNDYELIVFCSDGLWADLEEGQHETFIVKAR